MRKKRSRFTLEERANILKEHLLEKKALSDLCDKNNIHPTMFIAGKRSYLITQYMPLKRLRTKKV